MNVPGLRLAPVAANGIATINRLAPGRCFIGLGTGHTAMRTLGQKPMRLAPFREYVQTVRALLRGEEVDYTLNGETHPIRFVNARDAMAEGGMVKIETDRRDLAAPVEHAKGQIAPGRYVLLTVRDSGSGMDETTLGKIFETFFTTKETGKGTGLGLATVYGIVYQSGGAIGVDSAPGRGTTFTIYLPRIDAPVAAREAGANPGRLERGDETILLVEDDHEVRELAAEVLKAAGYTVLESGDPLEALIIGERHREDIRLLISDMVMPAMRGPALAAQILQIQPEARVLYMSGYTTEAIASQGAIDPPGPLLQKPFTPDGLARIVRQVLDSSLATS